MQKQTRTKKSPTNRRSRKLTLAKKTELSRHDLQQMSQTERFKRIYKFELKLKKAGWDFKLGEEGTYYATIEKDGLLRFLTHAQCLDYAVLNYSARKAELFANVFQTKPTEQDESAMQSGPKSPALVKCSGLVPEAACDIEEGKTVYSHVLREAIPAKSDIGARNVHRFLANADGPIQLATLCGWCEWVIQVITDDFGGETLYLITNEDWSDMSCFTDINAAKTHFVEKVIVSTRERIGSEIANKLNPPPAPTVSGNDDDDIPF